VKTYIIPSIKGLFGAPSLYQLAAKFHGWIPVESIIFLQNKKHFPQDFNTYQTSYLLATIMRFSKK